MNLTTSISVREYNAGTLSHMVQSRRDVPHQAHQEEGELQDGVRKEIQSAHELVIPCHGVEVDNEG